MHTPRPVVHLWGFIHAQSSVTQWLWGTCCTVLGCTSHEMKKIFYVPVLSLAFNHDTRYPLLRFLNPNPTNFFRCRSRHHPPLTDGIICNMSESVCMCDLLNISLCARMCLLMGCTVQQNEESREGGSENGQKDANSAGMCKIQTHTRTQNSCSRNTVCFLISDYRSRFVVLLCL